MVGKGPVLHTEVSVHKHRCVEVVKLKMLPKKLLRMVVVQLNCYTAEDNQFHCWILIVVVVFLVECKSKLGKFL